jgi:diaminobutyrate-2-oxoglutarate transaminase
MLEEPSSGLDQPAAVIVETVQAEGGIHVASDAWLRRLEALCRRHAMLLIVDDIQAGCGRTGPFFSFERAGIRPDVVCLSKSLSGYGLPLALVLLRRDLDVWSPGEHNGTFRGNNPAFVTAAAALDYWKSDALERMVRQKARRVRLWAEEQRGKHSEVCADVRGVGLIQGIDLPEHGFARAVSWRAFELGLVIETSGPTGNVLKLMPPLTIDDSALEDGLAMLGAALASVAADGVQSELGGAQ